MSFNSVILCCPLETKKSKFKKSKLSVGSDVTLGGKSVIPVAFWYFSISGGLVLLTYAIWRKDPVIIAGQSVGVFIYARNLYFINREKKENKVDLPK